MSDTLGGSLKAARQRFEAFLSPRDAEREARMILCHVLGIGAAQLLSRLGEGWPDPAAQRSFADAVEARTERQPLGQIIGEVAFYGRQFSVTRDVLSPRADTEALIDVALAVPFGSVLDLGTGSGCILATLLAERPGATGLGTDLSQAALAVAEGNLARHDVDARAALRIADWWDGVDGVFDLVVSNPPYITADEMDDLMPEVRDWEPHLALTPGGDGLDAYRAILRGIGAGLAPGGTLAVEIGHRQGQDVLDLFQRAGLEELRLIPDMNGKDRIVAGRRPGGG